MSLHFEAEQRQYSQRYQSQTACLPGLYESLSSQVGLLVRMTGEAWPTNCSVVPGEIVCLVGWVGGGVGLVRDNYSRQVQLCPCLLAPLS